MCTYFLYQIHAAGELVYIGLTARPKGRKKEHRKRKGLAMTFVVLCHGSDKTYMHRLETQLIRRLRPKWNRKGTEFLWSEYAGELKLRCRTKDKGA